MKRPLVAVLLFAVCLTGLSLTETHAANMITSTEMDHLTASPLTPQQSDLSLSPAAGQIKTRSSDDLINFIKVREGFISEPYWDYAQWTVGYGTCCRNDKGEPCTNKYDKAEIAERYRHVTEEAAEQFLREEVALHEVWVTKYEKEHNLSFTQNEFDALVSFTFNLGPIWTEGGYMINAYLEDPNPNKADIDLVRALGVWCRAGGEVLPGLARRRLDEAMVFLYGDYEGTNSNHTNFSYVVYDGNGSLLSKYYTDAIDYFEVGKPYGTLLSPVWNGAKNASLSESLHEELSGTKKPLPFTDVPEGKWYYDSVVAVYEQKLMNGITDTTFVPNGPLSRGQLVTILYRLDGSPRVNSSSGFEDVESGRYYSDAVTWAKKNKIVTGTAETTFSPERDITREQIATIFARYYAYKGGDVDQRADLEEFVDGESVSNYARDALSWAVSQKLLMGISNPGEPTMLKPQANCTRAQAAELLVRLKTLLDQPDNGNTPPAPPQFAGWFNSRDEHIQNNSIVKKDQVVTAKWVNR